MKLLMFLGGSSLLKGVGLVSTCPKVLNDFKADVFEIDPLIVITSITFSLYQVLAFSSLRRSSKFEYSFDYPSSFCYFTWLFIMTTGKVRGIIFDVRFVLADVDGIVDTRKLTIH